MADDRLIQVYETTGDVDGPSSSTDNAIARFDGVTGKILQNSSVYILDTGNVGIGTTSPSRLLHIVGTAPTSTVYFDTYTQVILDDSESRLQLRANNTGHGSGIILSAGTESWSMFVETNGDDFAIGKRTSAANEDIIGLTTPSFVINSSGRVGINDITPSYTLDVNGTGRFTNSLTVAGNLNTDANLIFDTYCYSSDSAAIFGTTGAGIVYLRPNGYGSSTYQTTFSTSLATIGTNMTVSGTVTATNFILSSDIRLKENIIKASILELPEIKEFTFKSDETKRLRRGVIAQELEKVAPEMVYENDRGFKQVAYTDFLLAKIASLETRLNKLENDLDK